MAIRSPTAPWLFSSGTGPPRNALGRWVFVSSEDGVIRDVSGTNFSGVAAEDFTVRTALTGSSPLGWRLVASNISAAGGAGDRRSLGPLVVKFGARHGEISMKYMVF